MGFSLLFLGLSFMKDSVPDLRQTPEVLAFVSSWASHGFGSVLIFLALGTVLTLIINQYERMGDFMINISQDLERAFVKR